MVIAVPGARIASVGGAAEEAIDHLAAAVVDAVRVAEGEGIDPGQPVPPAEPRRFPVSSRALHFARQLHVG
jgi:hypothetical protein